MEWADAEAEWDALNAADAEAENPAATVRARPASTLKNETTSWILPIASSRILIISVHCQYLEY